MLGKVLESAWKLDFTFKALKVLDFEGLGLDFLTKGLENSVWVLESLDFSVKSARIKSDVFIFLFFARTVSAMSTSHVFVFGIEANNLADRAALKIEC